MDLRQIRHFVVLAETLHFHVAAERLHLAQPSLSRSIKTLEDEVGTRLFFRHQREVRLSPAGVAFLPEARQLLRQADRTQQRIQDIVRGNAGLLHIGFLSSTAIAILPLLLRYFRDSHPKVQLELLEMSTTAQTKALLAGQIDVGFLRDTESFLEIQQYPIQKEKLLLLVPAGHILEDRAPVSLSYLSETDIVLLRRDVAPGSYDRIMETCISHQLRPRIFMELADSNAVLSMVAAGIAVSFLFSSFAQIKRPGVSYLPLQEEIAESSISVAWKEESLQENPALRAFVQLTQKVLKD